jgi:MFS family permease
MGSSREDKMLRSRNRGSSNNADGVERNPLLRPNDFDDEADNNIDIFDSPIPEMGSDSQSSNYGYRVYPERWIMLSYLSLLNLLSDWAGLSVAPIATLTISAYSEDENNSQGSSTLIQPEALVTVFLIASSIGTALEPWILGRLGLRRTVVFGAFANMIGSLVKSGGLPPLPLLSFPQFTSGLHGSYALYLGFFFVGFAQPLFQCTPALLSASWFPEHERTLATSIALNSNQLGVGLAFIVGALWVQTPDQVATYFSLLSFFSIAAFVGCALQLDDAPPTPPSGSSRIMRGTFEVSVRDLIQRASSSLLVGGDYDITKACTNNPFALRGEDGDAAGGSVAGISAVEASAKTLLSQHIHSSPNRKSRTRFDSTSLQQQLSSSLFAPSYTEDEFAMYDELAEPTITQTPHHLEIGELLLFRVLDKQ